MQEDYHYRWLSSSLGERPALIDAIAIIKLEPGIVRTTAKILRAGLLGRYDENQPTSAGKDTREPHRHHRWGNGDDHPHLRDEGSGYPRRAL